jgi:hypothetical protein
MQQGSAQGGVERPRRGEKSNKTRSQVTSIARGYPARQRDPGGLFQKRLILVNCVENKDYGNDNGIGPESL